MTNRPPTCPQCHAQLPLSSPELSALHACPACHVALEVVTFPALERVTASGHYGDLVVADGEAACFHHAHKRAVVPCGTCGRFLCALCDVEVDGKHLCAVCFERGATTGSIQALERKRTRYDNIVLSLVTLPLLFWCSMVLTAPLAIFLAIRYWNAPPSLVDRTKWRLGICTVAAVGEFIGASIFMYHMFQK